MIAKKDFKVVRPVSSAGSEVKISIKTAKEGISAKIEEGQTLGQAVFEDKDLVGSGYISSEPQVDMIAKNQVKRSFFLKVWWNHFVNYVNEKL
jgi:D-alanyl-D-alanine carboxypeptidase (penicillin-binding protein 5/6)